MEASNLLPFIKENLDILFIGLNPALGSNRNKHYFSVKQAFWNQLFEAGLITQWVDKKKADDLIFGSNESNYNNWEFGITDLVTEVAESDSGAIKPTDLHCERLEKLIKKYSPRVAIILHSKVLNNFLKYLDKPIPKANDGHIGELIGGCSTTFFSIAFPHGNNIPDQDKIARYREVKSFIKKN